MTLKNKIVLVTGANKGIGLAIANEFKEKGATVIATARKDNDIKHLNEIGYISLKLDVTDDASIDTMYNELLSRQLTPDILINNSGMADLNLISKTSIESWNNTINTNLNSVFKLTKKFIKHMSKKRFGRIINISSVLSSFPQKGFSSYSASKSAIESFTRVAALEYAKKGITFNCIAPGFVDTEMLNILGGEGKKMIESTIPVGYVAQPIDIAQLAIYIASARYLTGEVININGGLSFA